MYITEVRKMPSGERVAYLKLHENSGTHAMNLDEWKQLSVLAQSAVKILTNKGDD